MPKKLKYDIGEAVFHISPETIAKLSTVEKLHSGPCSGGIADFTLHYAYGSGIGTNITAVCCKCKDEFDVTDYKSW